MGRALLVMDSDFNRRKAIDWIGKAPVGTRVEFKASKRTLPQNDLLWALLTEVSQQLDLGGRKYDPSQWKAIFLHAFGREVTFLPSLDQKTFLPIELSSSDLSKDEMTDFIEFILKESAERGVVFRDPRQNNTDTDETALSQSVDAGMKPAEGEVDNPPAASPSNDPERDILIRFAAEMLPMAATARTEVWKDVELGWSEGEIKTLSPAGREKAKAISMSLRAIARGNTSLEAEAEYYAFELNCKPSVLGGVDG